MFAWVQRNNYYPLKHLEYKKKIFKDWYFTASHVDRRLKQRRRRRKKTRWKPCNDRCRGEGSRCACVCVHWPMHRRVVRFCDPFKRIVSIGSIVRSCLSARDKSWLNGVVLSGRDWHAHTHTHKHKHYMDGLIWQACPQFSFFFFFLKC